MPELEWNEIDLLDFFAVLPTAEEDGVSHSFEIDRNGLQLLLTIRQYESVIQVSVFRRDSDHALFTFTAYVRGEVRLVNDQRGRYLEIADCIVAPDCFWDIVSGDPFDRVRFPVAVTVTVAIDPDIRIAFVNFKSRT